MPFMQDETASLPESSTPPGALAQLQTISFEALIKQDPAEIARLATACKSDGFFYLDLTDQGSCNMHEHRESLKTIMKSWMQLPREEKCATYTPSRSHGYKPIGTQSGALESRKDGFEVLTVGHKELAGRWALPEVVDEYLELFDRYMHNSHFVLKTILASLSSTLGNDVSSENLEKWHRDDWSSMSTLWFLNYPHQAVVEDDGAVQNMHTDIGTLTLLFPEGWGLQVLSPNTNKEWQWVPTKPNHAIVNVGDTLRFLSQGRLRSALHRVVPVKGQTIDRFSVAYFLRANDQAEFEASDGVKLNARSWLAQKHAMYEAPHGEQKQDAVLTGGMMKIIEEA